MINIKERESYLTKISLTKASSKLASLKAKAKSSITTDKFFKATLTKAISLSASIPTQMAATTKDSSRTTSLKAKESFSGQMEFAIWEYGEVVFRKEKEVR